MRFRFAASLLALFVALGLSACDSGNGDGASEWTQAQGTWLRVENGAPVGPDADEAFLRINESAFVGIDLGGSDCYEKDNPIPITERDENVVTLEGENESPRIIRLTVNDDTLTLELLEAPDAGDEGTSMEYVSSTRDFMFCEGAD